MRYIKRMMIGGWGQDRGSGHIKSSTFEHLSSEDLLVRIDLPLLVSK